MSSAVAGVLRRLLVFPQPFAQLTVFFQQFVDIAVKRADFGMLGINRTPQLLKLGQ